MSTAARKRLMRDFKRLQNDPPAGVSGSPLDNNVMVWQAVIFGYVFDFCIENDPLCMFECREALLFFSSFFLILLNSNLDRMFLVSPDETPWEGGTFRLLMEFTEDYPNKPPAVRFLSKIFHPNVYNDGNLLLRTFSISTFMIILTLPSFLLPSIFIDR